MTAFIVTVDTEADDAWNQPDKITLANLSSIPRFQDLCHEYDIVPTYLVTYECASRDEAVKVLRPIKESGGCEIGHHLHVWTCPPFEHEAMDGVDRPWLGAFQSELPDSLFAEKAECLRKAIFEAYGDWPTSHRAGRWGIDERGARWLAENGFYVDSSVTPLIAWIGSKGARVVGPAFYSAPFDPYIWRLNGKEGKSETSILEIPLTVGVPSGIPARVCAQWLRSPVPGKALIRRAFRRLGGPVMLRPTPSIATGRLIGVLEQAIARQAGVLNLMLHSSELYLGASPRSRSREDAARVWTQLEAMFAFARSSGVKSSTLSGAAQLIEPGTFGREESRAEGTAHG